MTRLEVLRRLLAPPRLQERWRRLRQTWRMLRAILVLLLCLGAPASAWAQDDPAPPPLQWHTSEPVSLTVAMAGVVVTSAGFGLMLHTTQPCNCEPRTAWVVGGVIVVAAGVTMVWLGLRDKRVTVMPAAAPHLVGAVATIRWGGHHE